MTGPHTAAIASSLSRETLAGAVADFPAVAAHAVAADAVAADVGEAEVGEAEVVVAGERVRFKVSRKCVGECTV